VQEWSLRRATAAARPASRSLHSPLPQGQSLFGTPVPPARGSNSPLPGPSASLTSPPSTALAASAAEILNSGCDVLSCSEEEVDSEETLGLRTEADFHELQLQKIQQLLASEEAAVFEQVECQWGDSPETLEQNAARYERFRGEIAAQHINLGLDTASETSSELTNSNPRWVPPPPHQRRHERISPPAAATLPPCKRGKGKLRQLQQARFSSRHDPLKSHKPSKPRHLHSSSPPKTQRRRRTALPCERHREAALDPSTARTSTGPDPRCLEQLATSALIPLLSDLSQPEGLHWSPISLCSSLLSPLLLTVVCGALLASRSAPRRRRRDHCRQRVCYSPSTTRFPPSASPPPSQVPPDSEQCCHSRVSRSRGYHSRVSRQRALRLRDGPCWPRKYVGWIPMGIG